MQALQAALGGPCLLASRRPSLLLLGGPLSLALLQRAQGGLHWLGSTLDAPASPFTSTATAAASPPRGPPLLVLHPARQPLHSLQEALRLGESYAGATPEHATIGSASARRPSPATYFGRGQVEAAAARVAASPPSAVFVNAALSGVQQRNLERSLGVPVLDRVGLIIGIFAQRARTREARLQVELAQLEYQASRLVRVVDVSTGKKRAFGLEGDTEVVSARERGRSGATSGGLGGAGGAGESELQLQRRRVGERRKQLLRRLEDVRRTREVQRAARRRSGKPQVALVGYTNAGKSSLLAALSRNAGDAALAEDRLFATLDPTLRRVMLPGGRDVVLSDTVGFISNLPHQLVAAFQATLEEVTQADLLLHVLDASSPQVLSQRRAVLGVLRELGVSQERLDTATIELWNKADLLTTEAAAAAADDAAAGAGAAAGGSAGGLHAAAAAGLLPPAVEALLAADPAAAAYRPAAVATSAAQGLGLSALLQLVQRKLAGALGGAPQRSRRGAKHAAADVEDDGSGVLAAALQQQGGGSGQ